MMICLVSASIKGMAVILLKAGGQTAQVLAEICSAINEEYSDGTVLLSDWILPRFSLAPHTATSDLFLSSNLLTLCSAFWHVVVPNRAKTVFSFIIALTDACGSGLRLATSLFDSLDCPVASPFDSADRFARWTS
jgi:hypothetical protein